MKVSECLKSTRRCIRPSSMGQHKKNKLSKLRTDQGGEYCFKEVKQWCKTKDIKVEEVGGQCGLINGL